VTAGKYWLTFARLLGRQLLFLFPLVFAAYGLSEAAGVSFAGPEVAAAAVGVLGSNLTRRPNREAILRRVTRRPRMTPGDYRQLRAMELELGFEPSEPPSPAERAVAVAKAGTRAVEEALALEQSLAEVPALPPLDRKWTRADWDAYESVCRRSDPAADYLAEALSSGCLVNLQGDVPAPPRCECSPGTFSSVPVFTIESAVPVYSYCSGCHRKRR
jgi:hypothetical protein